MGKQDRECCIKKSHEELMILDKKQQELIDIGSVVTKASSVILFLLAIGYPKLRLLANRIG
jgi:hypothetical protein